MDPGGNTRQHASVVRGDVLRILNTVAGIQTAEVNKIYRQKNEEYRSAVENLSKGNVLEAFQKLDAMGSIQSIDPMQPNTQLVNDYMEVIRNKKTALIIAPTHKQCEEVTKEIRERLRQEKLIGKKEINATRFVNLNFTEAEKKDNRNFTEGQMIQFNQNAPGFTRGSMWHVTSIDDKTIQIKNAEGETKQLPTNKNKSYDVFKQDELPLSKGDRVRITRAP